MTGRCYIGEKECQGGGGQRDERCIRWTVYKKECNRKGICKSLNIGTHRTLLMLSADLMSCDGGLTT